MALLHSCTIFYVINNQKLTDFNSDIFQNLWTLYFQERKEERERIKAAKEAEKEMRKVERESKKQFALGSCLKVC